MRTSYEEKLAGKEWSTIRFCFRWNFQSTHAKEINAAIAINNGRHKNGPRKSVKLFSNTYTLKCPQLISSSDN